MFGSHTFRLASRALSVQRLPRPLIALPRAARQFSVSRVQQLELPPELTKHIEHTELYQKLKDKPETIVALVRLANIVEDAGIDLSSGKPPSPIQLFRLASNRKFNREVQSVMQELEKAGIDISSQSAMQEMLTMAMTTRTPPKDE